MFYKRVLCVCACACVRAGDRVQSCIVYILHTTVVLLDYVEFRLGSRTYIEQPSGS
jgi:hypothetical protein